MRVVAIDTGHFSLGQRHVRISLELRALGLVTRKTGLVDRRVGQETCRGKPGHRIVAIAAGEIAALVGRAEPVNPLTAAVTSQALIILIPDRRGTAFGKSYDRLFVDGIQPVP